MAYEMVCSCFRNCGDCGFCWGLGHALGATRSSVSRTSTPQATRAPASFRAGFFPHRLRFPDFRVSCPGPLVLWFSSSPIPWPLVLRFSCPLDLDVSAPAPVPGSFPHRRLHPRLPDLLSSAPWFLGSSVLRFPGSSVPWTPLDLPWSPLSPHRHLAAGYLRASFASMHSVAWGTFIRRSFGMSLPVVLQIP